MKSRFSVITRLSVMLTLLAGTAMLVLLMATDDALKRYQQRSADSVERHLSALMRDRLEQEARLLTDTLGNSLGTALYHYDLDAVQAALQHLQLDRSLDYIFIYDANGRILHDSSSELERYGEAIVQHLPPGLHPGLEDHQVWDGDHLYTNSLIRLNDMPYAALAVGFDFSAPMQSLVVHANALEREERALFQTVREAMLLACIALLPLLMLCARRLTRHLLSPLDVLTERSKRYAAGDRTISFELKRQDEIGRLGSALERMRRGLEQLHETAHQQAHEDAVTGLNNRRWFLQKLNEMLQRSSSINARLAVLFIDLDHFKQVNDTAGHERGDQLLREVTRRLQAALTGYQRSAPRLPIPLLARLGGDEFVVLLPSIGTAEEAAEVARVLSSALAPPFLLSAQYFSISCSIGITLYPDDGLNSSEILKHADIAMYSAKQRGRNQFAYFHPQMTEEIHERMQIHQGIRDALKQQQFHLEYQPIFCLQTGRIASAEALLRWRHPEHGLISPARFIPVIEESDLIEDVTRWVASQAASDLAHILTQNPHFSISINISGAALHQPAICDHICELKQQHRLPDRSLYIEITETSMIRHLDTCEAALRRWKEHGIEIWIDDFGTGYSSLAYINSLAIDGLKIDRSFVMTLSDGQAQPVIDAIIALSHSLQIETVAEGVETEAQHKLLQQRGVTYGQGFGLARPMELQQLLPLLEQDRIKQR